MNHPIATKYNERPILFTGLLRTYVELDVPYLLDSITIQSRLRLTNTITGEYVIYGEYGPHPTASDVFPDESLYMNVPVGMLRVRVAPCEFRFLYIGRDAEVLGAMARWSITAYIEEGRVLYALDMVDEDTKHRIRTAQYQRIIPQYLGLLPA